MAECHHEKAAAVHKPHTTFFCFTRQILFCVKIYLKIKTTQPLHKLKKLCIFLHTINENIEFLQLLSFLLIFKDFMIRTL